MKRIYQHLKYIPIGIVFLILGLYTLWWLAAAVSYAVLFFDVLAQTLVGWYSMTGFARVYFFIGALNLLVFCGIAIYHGVPWLWEAYFTYRGGWLGMLIGVIVRVVCGGALAVVAVPFLTVGWPIVLWLYLWHLIVKRRERQGSANALIK